MAEQINRARRRWRDTRWFGWLYCHCMFVAYLGALALIAGLINLAVNGAFAIHWNPSGGLEPLFLLLILGWLYYFCCLGPMKDW